MKLIIIGWTQKYCWIRKWIYFLILKLNQYSFSVWRSKWSCYVYKTMLLLLNTPDEMHVTGIRGSKKLKSWCSWNLRCWNNCLSIKLWILLVLQVKIRVCGSFHSSMQCNRSMNVRFCSFGDFKVLNKIT